MASKIIRYVIRNANGQIERQFPDMETAKAVYFAMLARGERGYSITNLTGRKTFWQDA